MLKKGFVPAWRDFHTAVALNRRMYVFGGRSDHLGQYHSSLELYFDKLHYLNLDDMTWCQPQVSGNRPSGRRSHSCWCYNGKMFLFGGYSGCQDKHFNDMYSFDPVTLTWTQLTSRGECPRPRRRMCTVNVGSKVFLFGGTMPSTANGLTATVSDPYGSPTNWPERNLVDLSDLYVFDYDRTCWQC